MLDNSLLVDDEQPTEGNAILSEDSVGLADLLLQVSHQGVVQVTQAALLRGSVFPWGDYLVLVSDAWNRRCHGALDRHMVIGGPQQDPYLNAHLAVGLDPGKVGELGVDGDAQDLGVDGLEFRVAITEGCDLRGANESEVQRVEEEHHVLAPVLGQRELHELLIEDRLCLEVWRVAADEGLVTTVGPDGDGATRDGLGDHCPGRCHALR